MAGLSPAVLGKYGFTDDYQFLYRSMVRPEWIPHHLIAEGRPLAMPLKFLFGACRGIDDLSWVRLVGVLGAAASAGWLCVIACRFGFAAPVAFLCGVSLLAAPSAVMAATWATLAHGCWALFLALVAGSYLLSPERPLRQSTLVSSAIAGFAVCLYQPAAMAFWLVGLLWILSPRGAKASGADIKRRVEAFLIVMVVCSVVGLVATLVGSRLEPPEPGVRSLLSASPLRKLASIALHVGPRVADPWSATPRPLVSTAVAAVMTMALWWSDQRRRLLRLAAVAAVLMLGCAPILVTADNALPSRTMMAVLPVLPICVVSVLQPLISRLGPARRTVVPVALALLVAAHAAHYLRVWMVGPQEHELRVVRRAVLEAIAAPSLTLLPSLESETFAPGVDHDEFGTLSTSKRWVMLPLVELICFEATGSWYDHAYVAARTDPTPGTAILDFAAVLKGNPKSDSER